MEAQSRYLLFDDFLPPDEAGYLWNQFQSEEYSFINTDHWRKVYRIHDGNPLRGPAYDFMWITQDAENEALQLFVNKINNVREQIEDFLADDTERFSVSFNAFPAGTGLSWHKDGLCKGALIYYVHPYWGAHWGGELCIASGKDSIKRAPDKPISATDYKHFAQVFDQAHDDNCLMAQGEGAYLMAKPNRLVILKPKTNHCVKPVAATAGAHMRCTLSGFFG